MRRAITGLMAATMLWTGAPMAAAGQLDAKSDPATEGPITKHPDLSGCTTKRERFKGQRAATFKICRSYWLFDPMQELDLERDYGAVWVQGSVKANRQKGWCTKRASVTTALPEEGVLSRSPRAMTKKIKKRQGFGVKLAVKAAGNTTKPASLRQRFQLLPGTTKVLMREAGHRMVWRGNTGKKLAFVIGYEISWPAGGQPPELAPRIEGLLRRSRNC